MSEPIKRERYLDKYGNKYSVNPRIHETEQPKEAPKRKREGFLDRYATELDLLKSIGQMVDPTGFSSYYDTYKSFNNMWDNPSWGNFGDLAVNAVGSLPLIGKVTVPFKAARAARSFSRIGDAVRTAGVASKNINRTIDTVPELIPFARKFASKVQDVTSNKFSNKLYDNLYNRSNYAKDYINFGADVVNIGNGAYDTENLVRSGKETWNKYK